MQPIVSALATNIDDYSEPGQITSIGDFFLSVRERCIRPRVEDLIRESSLGHFSKGKPYTVVFTDAMICSKAVENTLNSQLKTLVLELYHSATEVAWERSYAAIPTCWVASPTFAVLSPTT